MADDPKEKKKALYQQLVESADEELVLARMRELGFWPSSEPLPEDPDDEVKETLELEYELAQLRKKATVVADPQKALEQERVRRWKESKERRAKAKIERELEAKQRREAWETAKKERVWHAGEGVSAGLESHTPSPDGVRFGAPPIATPKALAEAMGIDLPKLRWLTYHRRAAALVHYHRFSVPKKTGGLRHISAPKKDLRRAQEWILVHVLERVGPQPTVHGFQRGRSVKSNATPHVSKRVVVNLDLEDFFPTLGFRRVKGVFRSVFGYPESVATVMALLCTEPPRVEAELDGKVFHVALGERVLPQGACTSPMLTNIACYALDRRLGGLAGSLGFAYTRYADDLTFSSDDPRKTGRLLKAVRDVVKNEGFVVNEAKTRVMRRGGRQEVTGVTVNRKANVSRKERRRLRALLHNAKKTGLAAQNRTKHPRFRVHLRGRIAWIGMLDAAQGAKLRAMLDACPD